MFYVLLRMNSSIISLSKLDLKEGQDFCVGFDKLFTPFHKTKHEIVFPLLFV